MEERLQGIETKLDRHEKLFEEINESLKQLIVIQTDHKHMHERIDKLEEEIKELNNNLSKLNEKVLIQSSSVNVKIGAAERIFWIIATIIVGAIATFLKG